jgi:hypothetical protein
VDDLDFDKGPHAPRYGRLKHGNPSGDLSLVPHCGAGTRAGHPCRSPAMANGRCRMHGGKSTGPRTVEGLERCRTAPLKHGRRSAAVLAERRQMVAKIRAIMFETSALGKQIDEFLRNVGNSRKGILSSVRKT